MSQNLIPNGSFEDTVCINNGFDNPFYSPIKHWFNPNDATPDEYTSSIDSIPCYFQSIYDSNWASIGDWQFPQHGKHFIGLVAGSNSSETREFLEAKLIEPLIADSTYCLSMYVSLRNTSIYAIDRFGLFFSADSIYDHSSSGAFELNSYITSPVGQFLTDTMDWIHIEGIYTSNGSEQFILIGNSFNNENTNLIEAYPENPFSPIRYFVDNVELNKCNTTALPEIEKERILIYPNPSYDSVTIEFYGESKWNLFDLRGKKLDGANKTSFSFEIDLLTLDSGMYVLVLENSSTKIIKKIIKE